MADSKTITKPSKDADHPVDVTVMQARDKWLKTQMKKVIFVVRK